MPRTLARERVKKRLGRALAAVPLLGSLVIALSACGGDAPSQPEALGGVAGTNVILFIGDGMGYEQVRAASMWATGRAGGLSFEAFPYRSTLTTHAAFDLLTDSAAAATAMATGTKVAVGVISMGIPGNGDELPTVLEHSKGLRKSTGLVTTTFISHATPAAFAAHETHRSNYAEIVGDYLRDPRPNVLFGGAEYLTPSLARDAGYTVVSDAFEMLAVGAETAFVSGQFGDGHMPYEVDGTGALPHLSEMTVTALRVLDNDPDGFFLMVEGGRIDHAGHANSIAHAIGETIEFSNAVQVAVDWAEGRDDTLIIVTADHETGGLTVLQNNGAGVLPTVSWATKGHTNQQVSIHAWGTNAFSALEVTDNTDIHALLMQHIR